MLNKWTKEQVWNWYKSYPWLRGCNFLPSNVINRIDMWQSHKHKEHLEIAEKELSFAEKIGFNLVRYWVNFDIYLLENDFFYESLENYISLAAKYHQYVILVLSSEEDLPYEGNRQPNFIGEQKDLKNHFNRDYKMVNYLKENNKYFHYMEDGEFRPKFIEMVKGIVNKYKNDKRVIMWNVMNEPGFAIGERSRKVVEDLTQIVKEINPSQPVASDVCFTINDDGSFTSFRDEIGFENSDLISYHCYEHFDLFKKNIENLKKNYDLPIIVTEWLHRVFSNNVEDVFPYLYENKIGACNWGFVAGKTNTTIPWDYLFDVQKTDLNFAFDLTLWQHDLFTKDFKPYKESEFKTILEICKQANNSNCEK